MDKKELFQEILEFGIDETERTTDITRDEIEQYKTQITDELENLFEDTLEDLIDRIVDIVEENKALKEHGEEDWEDDDDYTEMDDEQEQAIKNLKSTKSKDGVDEEE